MRISSPENFPTQGFPFCSLFLNFRAKVAMHEFTGIRSAKSLRLEKMGVLSITVWCALALLLCSWPSTSVVKADPISIDFSTCQPATYMESFLPNSTIVTMQCCPPNPTRPIVDGLPAPTTTSPRVRKAAQCVDEESKAKLEKAYDLMRALPDDDPRSMTQQWHLHCSYCGGSFFTTKGNQTQPIDIHYSWFFLPWHRFYLYFHERILQSLIGDPTLSLNYWNWDSPYSVDDKEDGSDNCLKAGDEFPYIFSDPSSSLYDVNRSAMAKGESGLKIADLSFSPLEDTVQQPLFNASVDDVISSNLNILYNALVSGGTTTEAFMGKPYRAGDAKGSPQAGEGAGSLENQPHAGVHFWTGHDPPNNLDDMGALSHAARDPVFYAHHGNLDRLFQVWKDIGQDLDQQREYYSDPDFLNAEFLFWDENADLRRVKVQDALDTTKLGYVYQGSNIDPWLNYNATRCNNQSYSEIVLQAQMQAPPSLNSDGKYSLQADTSFVIILDRPQNPEQKEEFLTISGIQLENCYNGGFDVYIDMVFPSNYTASTKCAEYTGRYMNMGQATRTQNQDQTHEWKQSITKTLLDLRAPTEASELVITLVPQIGKDFSETITFDSINISFNSEEVI